MDSDLLHACDVNQWHANAAFLGTSVKGEILETRDLHVTNCGFPTTDFNRAFVKGDAPDPDAAISRAERYFDDAGLPFAFTVRSDRDPEWRERLEAAGYTRAGQTPVMVLDPICDAAPAIPDLEIHEVAERHELAVFQTTAFTGFGLPEKLGSLFITEDFLHTPGVQLFLGRIDGEPVCTSALVMTPRVAGIYWVATLEHHRRRGLGECITWASVRAGLEAGCAIANLQASEMGAPVYARMGFDTPVQYLKYERVKRERG